jgi:Mn-dependent DtxR family transcriptional regulator
MKVLNMDKEAAAAGACALEHVMTTDGIHSIELFSNSNENK